MPHSLEHRTVIITGATSGFGLATAKACHALGAKIIITGRRSDRLMALQSELGAERCHILPLDVRDRDAVFHSFQHLPDAFAAVDGLVNNAGLALGTAPAPDISLDDWETMVDTNIKGLMYCTQAILPGMLARGRGDIVNIGSIAGSYAYPGGNAYGGTKAFVNQFTLNLKADLLGKPVRVTVIEPGAAETEFSQVRYKGDNEKASAVYANTEPLTAEDIAEAVVWVLTRPAHVNINRLEMMPTKQALAGPVIYRG